MGTKQERLPTSSGAVTKKDASATSIEILPANQNRITFEVMNNSGWTFTAAPPTTPSQFVTIPGAG